MVSKHALQSFICRPFSKSRKILFGTTMIPSYNLSSSYLFLLECSMLLSCCAVSLGSTEGLRHYQWILKDWGDRCVRGNSTYVFSRPRRSDVSARLSNVAAPKRELGDITQPFRSTRKLLWAHLQEPSFYGS
jgi:hypothetical protein